MNTLLAAALALAVSAAAVPWARAESPDPAVSISRPAAKLLKKRGLAFSGFKLCAASGQESGFDFAFGGSTSALKVKTDPGDREALLVGMLDKAGRLDSAIRVRLRGRQPVIGPVDASGPLERFFVD